MKSETQAQALRIYIGEQDNWHGSPLYAAIVQKLSALGLSGVTVLHGVEGYGSHHKLHTQRLEVLFKDLPIVIEAVDTPEKIQTALTALDEMIEEGLVTVNDVHAIQYGKD